MLLLLTKCPLCLLTVRRLPGESPLCSPCRVGLRDVRVSLAPLREAWAAVHGGRVP